MSILSNIRTAYENNRAEKIRLTLKKDYIADFKISGIPCVIERCQGKIGDYINGYCSDDLVFFASYNYDPSHQLGLCIEHLVKEAQIRGEFI